jgi:hypothetical protein
MEREQSSFHNVLLQWSAILPIAMSLSSLAMMLGLIALGVITVKPVWHQHGDQTIEHIFQILMTVQMPIVLFFAIKWLRRAPRPALRVLALQAGVWLAACAPVYVLHL